MIPQPDHCSKSRNDSLCNVKRLRDMSREIGAWGCAPWIGLWPLLVFFAPVSFKGKLWIFVASLVLFLYVFVMYNMVGNGDGLPWGERYLIGGIGIVLLLTYFILSYWALIHENMKRRDLYASLGEEGWQRLFYCTVHDEVVGW